MPRVCRRTVPGQGLVLDLLREEVTEGSGSARPVSIQLLALGALPGVALNVAGALFAAHVEADLGLERFGILDDGHSHPLEMV